MEVLGLKFPNCVGQAAGLDKDGIFASASEAIGFGFIEVGTVTPLPQEGNNKPRLFRFPSHLALVNRMGFNNHGVDALKKGFQFHFRRIKDRCLLALIWAKEKPHL